MYYQLLKINVVELLVTLFIPSEMDDFEDSSYEDVVAPHAR